MTALFAYVSETWAMGDILVAIVVIAAAVGIVYVALQQFDVKIPAFVAKIFWIVVCAVIAVTALRFILGLGL